MKKKIIIITAIYLVSLFGSIHEEREWVEKSKYTPEGVDVFIVFCPVCNTLAFGVLAALNHIPSDLPKKIFTNNQP